MIVLFPLDFCMFKGLSNLMTSSSFTVHDIADDIIARDSDCDLSEISESEYDYEDDMQSDVGVNGSIQSDSDSDDEADWVCWMMIWMIIYQSGAWIFQNSRAIAS